MAFNKLNHSANLQYLISVLCTGPVDSRFKGKPFIFIVREHFPCSARHG